MTINKLTAKQIAEMQDLLDMQQKEIETMLKRHDRERRENASPYFEQRREKQLAELKKRHVMERDRLVSIHEKEYEDAQTVRAILHNAEQVEKAEQLELNLRMKEEKEPEPKTILEKVREWVRKKLKNRELEM